MKFPLLLQVVENFKAWNGRLSIGQAVKACRCTYVPNCYNVKLDGGEIIYTVPKRYLAEPDKE